MSNSEGLPVVMGSGGDQQATETELLDEKFHRVSPFDDSGLVMTPATQPISVHRSRTVTSSARVVTSSPLRRVLWPIDESPLETARRDVINPDDAPRDAVASTPSGGRRQIASRMSYDVVGSRSRSGQEADDDVPMDLSRTSGAAARSCAHKVTTDPVRNPTQSEVQQQLGATNRVSSRSGGTTAHPGNGCTPSVDDVRISQPTLQQQLAASFPPPPPALNYFNPLMQLQSNPTPSGGFYFNPLTCPHPASLQMPFAWPSAAAVLPPQHFPYPTMLPTCFGPWHGPGSTPSALPSFCPPAPAPANDPSNCRLSDSAKRQLDAWYESHLGYPYPDAADMQQLMRATGHSRQRIQKWLANKRTRTGNTLPNSGLVHPLKVHKINQLRQLQLGDRPDVDADDSSAVGDNARRVSRRQPTVKSSLVDSSSADNNTSSSSRFLPDHVVRGFQRWYSAHLGYPYPTDAEKRQLAEELGTTVAKVTNWFANKRNRSGNSKKPIGRRASRDATNDQQGRSVRT